MIIGPQLYSRASIRSCRKALAVLGIALASVLHAGGSYAFPEGRSVAEQAGKEVSVSGKVIGRESELRKRGEMGYYDSILRLQTVDQRRVTVRASTNVAWCGTFGVVNAIGRAKTGDEVEAFGGATGRDDIDLCGSPRYYLKVIGKDEIAGWTSYRSEKYGFEMKYPRLWSIREDPEYVGFRDSRWDEAKIVGDSVTIKIFRDITRDKAVREAGFQTREEAIARDELYLSTIGEGKYYTQGDAAGAAEEAVETIINDLPALYAERPVRLYGGDEDKYIGASSGEIVLLFGDGIYATIESWAPVEVFDLIVSTFRFIGK